MPAATQEEIEGGLFPDSPIPMDQPSVPDDERK